MRHPACVDPPGGSDTGAPPAALVGRHRIEDCAGRLALTWKQRQICGISKPARQYHPIISIKKGSCSCVSWPGRYERGSSGQWQWSATGTAVPIPWREGSTLMHPAISATEAARLIPDGARLMFGGFIVLLYQKSQESQYYQW